MTQLFKLGQMTVKRIEKDSKFQISRVRVSQIDMAEFEEMGVNFTTIFTASAPELEQHRATFCNYSLVADLTVPPGMMLIDGLNGKVVGKVFSTRYWLTRKAYVESREVEKWL